MPFMETFSPGMVKQSPAPQHRSPAALQNPPRLIQRSCADASDPIANTVPTKPTRAIDRSVMAVPPASNAALSLEFLDRHTGSSTDIPAPLSRSGIGPPRPLRPLRPRTGRGTSYARGRSAMRASPSAPREGVSSRRRFFMAKSPAVPGARSRADRGPRLAALAIAAASWLLIMPATYAAEPPGSAADRGNQPSTDARPSGNLSNRLNQPGGLS